ncbi:MAG: hypothetical protein AAF721_22095, partial [Myxococcota bacterium]
MPTPKRSPLSPQAGVRPTTDPTSTPDLKSVASFAGGQVRRWELIGASPMTSALRRGAAGGGERVVRLRTA